MPEKEPTFEYEPNPEKGNEIPETKNISETEPTELPEEGKREIKKKKEEEREKEKAYSKEVKELVSLAKEEGFSKAYKKAKKLSKKKSAIIIDRFHDRLSQEDLDE